MAGENVATATPQAATAAQPVVAAQAPLENQATPQSVAQAPAVETPQEDLVSRVSKVKVEPKTQQTTDTNPLGLTKEDYEAVNQNPVLQKFYKSMLADYTRKTQQTSEERKEIENLKKQVQASVNWTPERLQAELNKPDFIQAAQRVASINNPPNSGLTDQEYSALTDKERAQLNGMQQEIQGMRLQNWQMQQKQQDEVLKTKYANYSSDIVDTTVNKLVRGEIQADREVVWKALDYNDAVNRAYQLGLQDKQLTNQEKQQALSPEGFIATPQKEIPKAEPHESNTAYFKRLASARLAEAVRGQAR